MQVGFYPAIMQVVKLNNKSSFRGFPFTLFYLTVKHRVVCSVIAELFYYFNFYNNKLMTM